MDLVDAHTHLLLPPPVMRRIRELFDGFAPGPLAYPDEPAAALEALRTEGVDTVWSLPYAHRGGTARRFNEHSAAAAVAARGSGVEIVAGATVHPADPSPADVVEEAVDSLGLRVLKLHSSVGGYRVDDPRLRDALTVCGERRVPVVVHLGHAVDGTTTADELAPLDVAAGAHPEVTFVAAHVGHPATGATLDLLGRHDNVWADLTPVVDDLVALRAPELTQFAGRLLFGSDAPNTRHRVADLLRWIGSHELPPQALHAILGGNARRLLAPPDAGSDQASTASASISISSSGSASAVITSQVDAGGSSENVSRSARPTGERSSAADETT